MRSLYSLPISLLSLSTLSPTLSALPQGATALQHDGPLVRQLYQYPVGTWIENIAIRSSGELLLTILTEPALDQFDPFEAGATPQRIHTFTGYLGLSGITEIAPDSFALATGNFSFSSGPQRGSWSIWDVDFKAPHEINAEVSKLADVPKALFLNGLTSLPSSKVPEDVLTGDIDEGSIRRVDTTTGRVTTVIKNKYTAAAPDPIFGTSGVDGVRVYGSTLYYINVAKQLFVSQPINADGTPAGKSSIIAKAAKPETIFSWDDFTIKGGDAYLVIGTGNEIEKIGLDGTPKGRVIAGNLNSTEIAGPTSLAFGRTERDSHVLYVVTSGGSAAPVDGNITVGAQVLAIDTRQWPC